MTTPNGNSRKGFGSMTPERRREIAAMGGKSVPAGRRSFSLDPDLAAQAGRKGGSVSPSKKDVDAG